jgi:hypothetical protein
MECDGDTLFSLYVYIEKDLKSLWMYRAHTFNILMKIKYLKKDFDFCLLSEITFGNPLSTILPMKTFRLFS